MFFLLEGLEAMKPNVHMLSHMPLMVRCWGPIWTHAAFAFEGMNGQLKALWHGTKDSSKEV